MKPLNPRRRRKIRILIRRRPRWKRPRKSPSGATISTAQRNAIMSLCTRKSITEQELEKLIEDAYKSTLDNLTTSEASSLIRSLQQAA